MMLRSQWRGLAYAVGAVMLFSTSPVLVRWAAPLSPFEITFWRLAIATLAVSSFAWACPQAERPPTGVASRRFLLYGLVAALHFLLYIASLSFTTIAHSLALVYTAPIFVTLLAALLLKEPIAPRKYPGIGLAVVGVGLLTGFEPQASPRMLVGDLLAVGSAVCFGFYSVIGRYERARYPLLEYARRVYGMAALWLLPAALASFTPAYNGRTISAVLLLGLFPLALGHTLYNAGLRRTHATYVNLIATQEVTGGVLLGYLLLREVPSPNALLGCLLMLAGTGLVLR